MKTKPLFVGFLSMISIAFSNRQVFAETPPAVIENARQRLIAIDNEIKPLLEQGLKDGKPNAAVVAQIEALEAEAAQCQALQKAAARSHELAQIPESERFAAEFNLGKSQEKDLSKFSLLAACNAAVNQHAISGILAELRVEAQKELQASGVMAQMSDIAIPRMAMEYAKHKAAMARFRNATQSVTGSNLGSQFVQTEVRGDLLQLSSLLASPVLERAGAFVLRGLIGNIAVPVIAPTGTITTKAENASANAVDHATTSKSLTPKRLPAYVDVSDQLVMQSSPDVEALLLSLILERMAFTKDEYGINGTASSTVPQGIIGTSGIGSVAGGTNGLAPAWSHVVGLETAVANANATGNVYVTNSKVRGKMKTTPKVASTDSVMLWGADNTLNGYRTEVSNVVPSTLDKGSSTGVCSAILFGDFSKLLMAYWGGLMIEKPRDKTAAITGTGTIVVTEFFDSIVLQPAAFAAMLDALTT